MPISDAYIIQYLLDGTSGTNADIHWCEETDHAAYAARLAGVEVILEPVYSRGGSRLTLRFRHESEEFSIQEPAGAGWLGRKFSSDDERHLVSLFRSLMQAVVTQCNLRRQRAELNREEIRERISYRLLFGEPQGTSNRTTIAGAR